MATVTQTPARVRAAKASAKKIIRDSSEEATHIIFIMDKSSSMETMRETAISSFNQFLRDQQALPGKAYFSLVLFSNDVILVYERADIRKIPLLNFNTYKPDGMTALYDAIGFTIDRFKRHTNEKIILAVLTDGNENYSQAYSFEKVKMTIDAVSTEGKWEVLFLGANINSRAVAGQVGIKLNNTTDYDFTAKGMTDALKTASVATSILRGYSATTGDGVLYNAQNLNVGSLYETLSKNEKIDVNADSTVQK